MAKTTGTQSEIVGRHVVNLQGDTLGVITDTAIDLEHGRYVGVLVASGGFLGIAKKYQVVPPSVLKATDTPGVLLLDITPQRFRDAPAFTMSEAVGPPSAGRLADLYRYYGQAPYFTTQIDSALPDHQKGEQLGFIQEGSKILLLPVDNLQGRPLGRVMGFHDINRASGLVGGVIISPDFASTEDSKIVKAQALRYDLSHSRLRLNDHEQPFEASPDYVFKPHSKFVADAPDRPGTPPPPLIQGNSSQDKRITLAINNAILGDRGLSHYAKNVEVSTVQGKTILRGRVENTLDRNQIQAYADQAAGARNVSDLLEVRPMSASETAIDAPPAAQ